MYEPSQPFNNALSTKLLPCLLGNYGQYDEHAASGMVSSMIRKQCGGCCKLHLCTLQIINAILRIIKRALEIARLMANT